MHNKYLEQATQRLKDVYQVDLIKDILLGKKDRVLLFADVSNSSDVKLEVISNTLTLIGLPDVPSISLNHILEQVDYDNRYAEIAGNEGYKSYIYEAFFKSQFDIDVTIPIKTTFGKTWVRFNMYPIDQHPNLLTTYITNVTELLVKEEALYEKIHKDALTGLFNKYTFDYHYGKRYQWPNAHVMYLDLDDFKKINDTLGHPIGNWFLVEFAHLLKSLETASSKFYRIGGDEFIGLIFEKPEKVIQIADEIIHQTALIRKEQHHPKLTVSIGIVASIFGEDLARKADDILYKVKKSGKNHYLYEKEHKD
jgi:diguanylate cyclase